MNNFYLNEFLKGVTKDIAEINFEGFDGAYSPESFVSKFLEVGVVLPKYLDKKDDLLFFCQDIRDKQILLLCSKVEDVTEFKNRSKGMVGTNVTFDVCYNINGYEYGAINYVVCKDFGDFSDEYQEKVREFVFSLYQINPKARLILIF